MGVIAILILISLALALLFLGGFVWAVKSGQFEDTFTPSLRLLTEEEPNQDQGPASIPTKDLTRNHP